MTLRQSWARKLLVMLLAVSGVGLLPNRGVTAPPPQIAQVGSDSITGRLDANSYIWEEDGSYYNIHTFEGVAGQTLTMEMVSQEFDTFITLIGSSGAVLAQVDDSLNSTNAMLAGILPETWTYQVVANSYGSGEVGQYFLTWEITAADSPSQPSVEPRQTRSAPSQPPFVANAVTGQLDGNSQTFRDGTSFDVYAFEGTAGDSIALAMASDAFDAVLILVKPDGEILASYDGGGEGSDVEFMLRLPDTGSYQLYATSNNPGETGSYRLSWRALTAAEDAELPSRNQSYYSDRFSEDAASELSLEDGGTAAIFNALASELPKLEEQLDVLRVRLGNNHPEVASSLEELAGMYHIQGRYADAEPLYLEALSIYRSLPSADPEEESSILNSLANMAYLSRQSDKGDALVRQADAVLEEAGIASDSYDEASLMQALETDRAIANSSELYELARQTRELATDYHRQGRYDEAETLYQEAIEILRGTEFWETVLHIDLNYLALLYQDQGRYDEAQSLYQEALEITRNDLLFTANTDSEPDSEQQIYDASLQLHSTVPILYNLAGLYRLTGDISQAVSTFRSGLDIEEQAFDFSFANLPETERVVYLSWLPLNTLDHVLSLNLNADPNLPEAKQFALTTLLRRKGRLLEAGARTQEILRQDATPEELNWLNQLTQIQQEISNLTLQPPADLSPNEYQTQLTQLRSEANRLEAILTRRSSDLALTSQTVDLEAVQAQIPGNGVLIEYVVYQPFDPANPLAEEGYTALVADRLGEPRYAAYLLFPDGRIEVVDLGDAAEIDDAVKSFVGLLQNRSAQFQQRTGAVPVIRRDVVEGVTSNLRELIFDPIAPYLQDTEHLLISPDSQLNRVPFEALQTETGGNYLVQQYQISYLNSGRDLLRLGVIEPSQNPAVILADPDYETTQVAQGRSLGENRRSNDLSQIQVGRLPGTAAEADAIQSLLPNATVLTEDEATENALKQVNAPRILHIATHGFFLPDADRAATSTQFGEGAIASIESVVGSPVEDPLLRSGLALAGFNTRSSGTEDGVLTALEASQLNLFGTQLVVLSACDTGLGDIANGEGVYGLRRAFAIAGTETQLLSLWQVSDFGTQNLMARYYEKLTAGMGRSEALREVQLEMIEAGEQYSHPYYWAAFILTGDWRSL
ncbi:MAG: CHAT domain-containing protein [Cyanobacteria bacterium P01_H01_bin.58]